MPAVGAVVLVLLSAVSLGRGDFPIGLADVLRAMAGLGDPAQQFVVRELRAPRIVVGLLVGAALGVAGALFQTSARNPLASPDVLGITQGASAGAVAAIVLGGGGLSVPLAALGGALLTGALLFGLTWRAGVDGARLVLVGIALWAVASALVDWLLTRADIRDAASAYVWITGSLNARTWEHAVPLALALAVLLPSHWPVAGSWACSSSATTPPAGSACAWPPAQAAAVLVAVGCVAAAVAAAGPIGFVALAVPQLALRLDRRLPAAGARLGCARCGARRRRRPRRPHAPAAGAPRRHPDRRHRRPVPALAPRPRKAAIDPVTSTLPGPNGSVSPPSTSGWPTTTASSSTTWTSPSPRAPSPRSSDPTAAASPPCCAPWAGCCGRRRGRCSWTDGDRPDADPRGGQGAGSAPQSPVAPEGLTVADLVARGRYPHQSWLRQWSRDDEALVAEALAWTGITDLAGHPVDALSGGQRQRAWISMALAQGTDLLLLDEPTTYLDLAHQIDVLELSPGCTPSGVAPSSWCCTTSTSPPATRSVWWP